MSTRQRRAITKQDDGTPQKKDSGGSGITIRGTAYSFVCTVFGAVISVFALNWWKNEEMQQQHQSCSEYVIHSRVKVRVFVCCWPVVESLS